MALSLKGPLLHQPYVIVTGLLEDELLGLVPPQALSSAPPALEARATVPACLRKLLRFIEATIMFTPSCMKNSDHFSPVSELLPESLYRLISMQRSCSDISLVF